MLLIGGHEISDGEGGGEGEGDEGGDGRGGVGQTADMTKISRTHAMSTGGRRRYRRCCNSCCHKVHCYLIDSTRLLEEEH